MDQFQKKTIKEGEALIKEGELDHNLYILIKGCLKVYKAQNSSEFEIATILPGQVVGEMSFLDKKPRSASVKALKESIIAIVPRSYYEEFLKTLPDWLIKLQSTILKRLRDANEKIII